MTWLEQDVAAVLSRRHENGGDFWASADGKVYVGNPYSTIGALGLLHELGLPRSHEAVSGGLDLIRSAARSDGRIRLGPKTPMYPCYTAEAARMLCRFGLADEPIVEQTVRYFLESTHETGGWRCSFSRFGKGPETACGSPGATLLALDVLRHRPEHRSDDEPARGAVELLLGHWVTREPLGPCHHGIGSRFLQVEFPFVRYNLFYYVYVLSFYASARSDPRFREALATLAGKVNEDGQVIVEAPHRGLGGLQFCARGKPSHLATVRYDEIRSNVSDS